MQTTSAKAGASFIPVTVEYNELMETITAKSWLEFERISKDDPEKSGVKKQLHWVAKSIPKPLPAYQNIVENFELLEGRDLPEGFIFGWRYYTFFIDISVYLPWLFGQFLAKGGKVVWLEQGFPNLEKFQTLPAELIFNCTGLGAKELCGDELMIPVKGQIAVIPPQPQLDRSISIDRFHIYPRRHDTILGGSLEWGVDNELVENSMVELIIEKNQIFLPNISLNSILRTYAGRMPYRQGSIRLEAQEYKDRKIIHNYGHGGAGITASWGSARMAVELI